MKHIPLFSQNRHRFSVIQNDLTKRKFFPVSQINLTTRKKPISLGQFFLLQRDTLLSFMSPGIKQARVQESIDDDRRGLPSIAPTVPALKNTFSRFF